MANYWVISDQGYLDLLNALRNGGLSNYLNGLTLRIWVNNFVPVHNSLLAAFTEMTVGGYAAQATTNWGAAAVNSGGLDTDTLDLIHTFTATGAPLPQTVYGAYLTDATPTKWILAWRSEFADAGTPAILDAAGKSYAFQPRLTLARYAAYP